MLHRLRAAREKAAKLVAADPAFLPFFERLELEVAVEEASDPLSKARAILALRKFMVA